jgi:single-strand DNA-binding protein
MYNRVFLIGRLTKDPEVRYTPSGIAVARFTLAINRARKNDEADFIKITAWRKLAEICGEYLKKGRLIAIEGRLQMGSYEKEGVMRSTAEVVADNMQMLEKRGAGEFTATPVAVGGMQGSEGQVPF